MCYFSRFQLNVLRKKHASLYNKRINWARAKQALFHVQKYLNVGVMLRLGVLGVTIHFSWWSLPLHFWKPVWNCFVFASTVARCLFFVCLKILSWHFILQIIDPSSSPWARGVAFRFHCRLCQCDSNAISNKLHVSHLPEVLLYSDL